MSLGVNKCFNHSKWVLDNSQINKGKTLACGKNLRNCKGLHILDHYKQTNKQNCRPRYKEYKKILKTLDWSFSEQSAIFGL